MLVVIDSNVWISALVFGGKPRQIFETVVRDGHMIAISDELVSEIKRILRTKFPNFVSDFELLLVSLGNFCTNYEIGHQPVTVCRDPNDNYLLELASISSAHHLISGDKDLLDMRSFRRTSIISPARFQD